MALQSILRVWLSPNTIGVMVVISTQRQRSAARSTRRANEEGDVTFKGMLSEIWSVIGDHWDYWRWSRRQPRCEPEQPWERSIRELSRRVESLESLQTRVVNLEGEQVFVRKLVSDMTSPPTAKASE